MSDNNEETAFSHVSPFEEIRRESEDGSEFWSARDLAKILGYTEYRKFQNAIKKAEVACENSGQEVSDHFAHVSEMVGIGSGAKRKILRLKLGPQLEMFDQLPEADREQSEL